MEKEKLEAHQIKNRIVRGVVTFTVRTFVIQVISFFGIFILTVILDPSSFGIFFIVTAILNIFVYFSDVGLAAALIQKKESLTQADLATTFIIQQAIVLTLVIAGLFSSKFIAGFYGLDAAGLFLLRILVFSLFLSSLKTIPSVILERNLNFEKLVIPQIAETIIFYGLAVVLATKGYGVYAFAWAALARGFTGLALIYILRPWFPVIIFEKNIAKKLVRFGIPFQSNSILALIKDDLLTVFVGKLLNYTQVGYIGWGQKFAFLPLRFMMDSVIKVTFPAYSRLQEDKDRLKKAVDESIFSITALVYPAVVGICVIAPELVRIIPRYNKWEGALIALYLFGVNAMFASVNTTLTNIMFALGKPGIVLRLMILWTALTWILTFTLFKLFGFIGVPLASAIVAGSTSLIVYYAKKEIPVSVLTNIKTPLIATTVMLICLLGIRKVTESSYLTLGVLVISGILIYVIVAILLDKKRFLEIYRLLFAATITKGKL